jgi:hypothetical protein
MDPDDLDFDLGTAGASARREFDRRRANRESRTREEHPRIGGLLLKLQDQPQHEQAWATGATGEEELAALLARRCPDVVVLNDRRMPGSRANIDHLAVAPSGVYVIDAKRYKRKIEVRKERSGEEKLFIGARNKTKLIAGLSKQVEAVQAGLALIEKPVPVTACLCFIDGDMPLLRSVSVKGYPLLHPRRLAKRLNRPGDLGNEDVLVITEALAELFPVA